MDENPQMPNLNLNLTEGRTQDMVYGMLCMHTFHHMTYVWYLAGITVATEHNVGRRGKMTHLYLYTDHVPDHVTHSPQNHLSVC